MTRAGPAAMALNNPLQGSQDRSLPTARGWHDLSTMPRPDTQFSLPELHQPGPAKGRQGNGSTKKSPATSRQLTTKKPLALPPTQKPALLSNRLQTTRPPGPVVGSRQGTAAAVSSRFGPCFCGCLRNNKRSTYCRTCLRKRGPGTHRNRWNKIRSAIARPVIP